MGHRPDTSGHRPDASGRCLYFFIYIFIIKHYNNFSTTKGLLRPPDASGELAMTKLARGCFVSRNFGTRNDKHLNLFILNFELSFCILRFEFCSLFTFSLLNLLLVLYLIYFVDLSQDYFDLCFEVIVGIVAFVDFVRQPQRLKYLGFPRL